MHLLLIGLAALAWPALAFRFECFAWPLYPFVAWRRHQIERRYPRPVEDSAIDGIIVLGGGIARLKEALQIADRNPNAFLFISGPKSWEAKYFREAPHRPKRHLIDLGPRNTFENALGVKRLIGPALYGRWILVTSAMHMARALATFQAQNLQVEPWPIFDSDGRPGHIAHLVLHEWLGLLLYRLRGRLRTVPTAGAP